MQILGLQFSILVGIDNEADEHVEYNEVPDEEEYLKVGCPPPVVIRLGLLIHSDCAPGVDQQR